MLGFDFLALSERVIDAIRTSDQPSKHWRIIVKWRSIVLVLSRKPDESINFPGLGITVSVLRSSSRSARLGIEAPPNIRVLRKELMDGSVEETFDVTSFEEACGPANQDLHELRNQLNTLNLGLQFYRHQMEAGLVDEANVTFQRVLEQLARIETSVAYPSDASAERAATEDAKLRVLLVEDDATQRELLAGVLSMQGFDVATAGDGDQALDYLEENERPDYILLDMRMPTRDGASLVRQLREINTAGDLRILATSGTSPEDAGLRLGPSGVDEWFCKPINADNLVRYMRVGNANAAASN